MMLIITFVSVLIILMAVLAAKSLMSRTVDKVDCAGQVVANSFVSDLSKGSYAPEINCPSKDEPIPAGSTDEQVKARIAADMVDCWKQWGKGDLLLFDDDKIYCHVCSFIEFEDKKGEVPGLFTYLIREEALGTGKKYIDYLSPKHEGPRYTDLQNPRLDSGSIDKSKNYAVIFYYLRGEEAYDFFITKIAKDNIGRGLAAGGGFMVGGAVGYTAVTAVCIFSTFGTCAIPAAIGGLSVGLLSGGIAQYFVDEPPNYASFILFRELSEESIEGMGCQWSP